MEKNLNIYTYIKDEFQYPANGIKYPEQGLMFYFDSKRGKKILEIGMLPAGTTDNN